MRIHFVSLLQIYVLLFTSLLNDVIAQNQIATTINHMCVINLNGDVYCTGRASVIGIGDTSNTNYPLVKMTLPNPAIQICADSGYTCVLLNTHSLMCTGLLRNTGVFISDLSYIPMEIATNIKNISPSN